ncbi:hypothetical protein CPB85DRAFT_1566189 [Mucidula mucida]|nr:hypothetical protein CPB85DRAFT_1566189 [Mucidula mucida]
MQQETKRRHAKAPPGYNHLSAKQCAAKKRKMESSKSLTSRTCEAHWWLHHRNIPSRLGPRPRSMSMNTFNRQTFSHRRLLLTRRYSNGRPRRPHSMVMRSMAVAGPSNQQYAQPTYALDGFNEDSAFLTGYKFNPIPVTTPLDPNDSLEETTISLRRRLFQPEIEWGINFDELRRDDVLIKSMTEAKNDRAGKSQGNARSSSFHVDMDELAKFSIEYSDLGRYSSWSELPRGETWGAYITQSFINPTNWTRSYTRSAYIDPLPPRSNLDILADATVTRIVFEKSSSTGNLTATGVEYAASAGAATSSVSVKKEVILAGGVIGSPQVLMLSDIGPTDVLESAGVTVQNALPGVGQHVQDHLVAAIYWSTDVETAGTLYANGLRTPEFTSYINSATAYVNLTAIMGESARSELVQSIADAADASASLVPSQYQEVVAGYRSMYSKAVELFQNTPVGNIELLLAITGAGAVGIQAGLQHPMSPGHIYMNSSSAFDYPVIDPGYLSHSSDLTILREGIKLARIAGNTPPLSNYLTGETSPGSEVDTDEEWEAWLKDNARTEYHPRGSCSMLPLDQGGVVNAKLQVYGTDNVRVADSAIFPIDMSCHLEAPTIGVAEKAAEIILAQYNGGSGSGSNSNGGSFSSSGNSDDSDSASPSLALSWWTMLGASLVGVLLF